MPSKMRRPSEQILDILTVYEAPVSGLAIAQREIVLKEAPDAVEQLYRNHPTAVWFGFGAKMKDMFCYIATTRTHVNLGFCRGASLPDPDQVFEGAGKMMRHVKFWSDSDVGRPFVRRYIRAAVRQGPSARSSSAGARLNPAGAPPSGTSSK